MGGQPPGELDRVAEVQPLHEHVDLGAMLAMREAVPRPLHRDEQVPVDHVAAVLQQAAHALAVPLRHDKVDVLGGAAKPVHQRARRRAVQPDASRAHDPERDAPVRGRRHDRDGLGLQFLPRIGHGPGVHPGAPASRPVIRSGSGGRPG